MASTRRTSSSTPAEVEGGQFRLLFENNPLPMWVYDLETLQFLEVNHAAVETYGYSREEFLGLRISDIRPKEDVERLLKHVKARRPVLQHSGEWRHRRKNGAVIDVEVTTHRLKYQGRKAALVVAQDITHRKEMERALAEAEEKYRVIFEYAADGIFQSTPRGRYIKVNSKMARIYGYDSPEDMIAAVTSIARQIYVNPRQREEFTGRIKTLGLVENFEAQNYRKDGSVIWTSTNARAVRDARGRLLYYEGFIQDITERKRAEEALRSTEERFSSAFEHAAIGMALVSLDGRWLQVNRSLCHLTGYSEQELLAKTFQDITHPDDLQADLAYARQLLAGEIASYQMEKRYIHKAGHTVWILLNGSLVRDEQDAPLYFIAQIEDITEQKNALEALHSSESKFRALVEQLPAVVYMNPSGDTSSTLYVSPQIETILGYTPKEWLADPKLWSKRLHPEDRQAVLAEAERINATGEPFEMEYRLLARDGRAVWVNDRVVLARDLNGQPQFWQGLMIDITARKQAEESILVSEAKYRSVVENSLQGISIFQGNRLIFVNPTICKILGYSAEELLSMNAEQFFNLVHPEDRAVSIARQAARERGETAPDHFEYRTVRKDGTVRWLESFLSNIQYEGRPSQLASTIDITERKQAERARFESEAKYRSLFENIPDGVYRTGPDGRILAANPSLVKMLGFGSEAELLAANVARDLYADLGDRQREQQMLEQAGELRNVEITLRCKDGRLLTALDNARSVRDEHGQVMYFEGTLTDISERKRAEQALRTSEAELQALFSAMPDVILVLNKEGRYLRIAADHSELLYKPSEQMLGKRLHEIFSRPKADQFLGYIRVALETRSAVRFEYELLIRDRILWFSGAVSAIGDETVVWVARDITAQKSAEQQIQRRLIEQEALYENGLALSSALDPRQIGDCVIRVLEKHLDWHHAAVRLVRPGTDEIELLAFSHSPEQRAAGKVSQSLAQAAITRVGQGMVGWVIEYGRMINTRELKSDPRYHETFPGMQAGLYVPIRAGGRVLGCVSVETDHAEGFTEDDERLLTTLAAQAAAALENARLFGQIQRRAEEFASLYDTVRDIAAQQDVSLLLKTIVQRSAALLNVSTSGIYLYDSARNDLYVAVNVGFESSLGLRLEMGEGVAGRVAQTREPLIIDDYQTWEGRSHKYDGPRRIRAVLEVPMLYGGELIGVLTVDELGDSQRRFTEDDSRLLSLFASHAASAIHNARLLAQTGRRAEELGILAQVSSALRTASTRAEMTTIILDQVLELLRADGAFLALRAADTGEAVVEKTRGNASAFDGLRLPAESITGRILADGRRYVNADIRTDPNMFLRDRIGATRAVAGIPLATQERTVGVLWVQRDEENIAHPDGFAENELSLLTSIADMAANALQRSALHEETLRYAEQLLIVNNMGRTLAETLELQKIYERLAQSALDLVPDSAGLFISLFDAQNELITAAYGVVDGGQIDVAGLPPMALTPLGEGNQSTVIHTGQPLVVADLSPSYQKDKSKAVIVGSDGPVTQSAVFVPMILQGKVIGVLQLQSYIRNRYTEADAQLLSLVANTAAVAIQNASLYDETRRRVTQLATLNEVGRAVSEQLDLKNVYETTLDQLKQNLPLDALTIALLDSQTQMLTYPFSYDNGQRYEVAPGPLNETRYIREVVEKGIPILRNLSEAQIAAGRNNPETLRFGDSDKISASLIFAPLVVRSQIVGVISVQSYILNAYTRDHLDLVVGFANQLAIAIQNARLFRQVDLRVEQLSALHSIDTAISSSTDLNVSLQVVLENLTRQLDVHAADVLLLSPVTHLLEYAAGLGFKHDHIKRTALHLGQGFGGQVAQTRRMLQIHDFSTTEPATARPQVVEAERFVSYVGVPLIAKGTVKGVLEVFHRSPLQPGEDWLAFLDVLAREAAIAIDNALLFQNLDRANTELTLAYDATIAGWSQALEFRDQETQGHASRVMQLTLQLAGAAGIPDSQLLHIRRGVMLHDIGKMAVPDEILHKPGSLNDAEWAIMRKHPEDAFKMLSPITYLRPAMDIPYCHHEKWDGSGYPRGLKGEAIPLTARLFAVVDVFDALTSDRPYRKAWPVDKALAYIQAQSGKHFDPRIVKAFLEHMQGVYSMNIAAG